MPVDLSNKAIEYKISQISGSLALSGFVATKEMKEIAKKILSREMSIDTATESIKLKHSNLINKTL